MSRILLTSNSGLTAAVAAAAVAGGAGSSLGSPTRFSFNGGSATQSNGSARFISTNGLLPVGSASMRTGALPSLLNSASPVMGVAAGALGEGSASMRLRDSGSPMNCLLRGGGGSLRLRDNAAAAPGLASAGVHPAGRVSDGGTPSSRRGSASGSGRMSPASPLSPMFHKNSAAALQGGALPGSPAGGGAG